MSLLISKPQCVSVLLAHVRLSVAKSRCKGKHKSPIPITFANGSYIALSTSTNTMTFNTLAPRSNPRKPVETKNSQGSRGNLASPGSSQIQKNPTRKPDSSVVDSVKVVVVVTMCCCSQPVVALSVVLQRTAYPWCICKVDRNSAPCFWLHSYGMLCNL